MTTVGVVSSERSNVISFPEGKEITRRAVEPHSCPWYSGSPVGDDCQPDGRFPHVWIGTNEVSG